MFRLRIRHVIDAHKKTIMFFGYILLFLFEVGNFSFFSLCNLYKDKIKRYVFL